jgi:hypothetical protein
MEPTGPRSELDVPCASHGASMQYAVSNAEPDADVHVEQLKEHPAALCFVPDTRCSSAEVAPICWPPHGPLSLRYVPLLLKMNQLVQTARYGSTWP